jgi:protein ImuA
MVLANYSQSPAQGKCLIRQQDPAVLAGLKAKIRRLERGGGASATLASLPLGAPALDRRLPAGGLPLGVLHELEGARGDWDDGAATGFCLLLLQRLLVARAGPVIWVSAGRDLYGPGLLAAGLDPGRFLFVTAAGEGERLWAMEEALREPGLAAVLGEIETLTSRAARRLQLAAEAGGVTAFALRRGLKPSTHGREPSTAATRWRVSALPSGAPQFGQRERWIGTPRWRVELLRCRGAAPAAWDVSWNGSGPFQGECDATDRLDLVAVLRDGSLAPAASSGAGRRLAG